jgi:hypothetical protein
VFHLMGCTWLMKNETGSSLATFNGMDCRS